MAIQIDGTVKKKSGGGGLGSLLGKIIGGAAAIGLAPVTGGASIAAGLAGANVGGALGGAAGNMVDPAKEQQLGVAVGNTGPSNQVKQETSAIDRLNKVMDIGSAVYGGVNTLNNFKAPKLGGASTAIDRRMMRMG
jgi:hypothetical protein